MQNCPTTAISKMCFSISRKNPWTGCCRRRRKPGARSNAWNSSARNPKNEIFPIAGSFSICRSCLRSESGNCCCGWWNSRRTKTSFRSPGLLQYRQSGRQNPAAQDGLCAGGKIRSDPPGLFGALSPGELGLVRQVRGFHRCAMPKNRESRKRRFPRSSGWTPTR